MGKSFADVFPTLELSKDDSVILFDTTVDRISTTRKREYLHIYLTSRFIIEKPVVRRVERAIKNQLFADDDLTVRIFERFALSSQYTPENFFEKYRDSFFDELRTYRPVMHALLRKSEYCFTAGEVQIRLEDSIVAKDQAPEIERVFEKVFNERGGFSVNVVIDYIPKKKKESAEREEEDEIAIAEPPVEMPAPAPVRAADKKEKGEPKKKQGKRPVTACS